MECRVLYNKRRINLKQNIEMQEKEQEKEKEWEPDAGRVKKTEGKREQKAPEEWNSRIM